MIRINTDLAYSIGVVQTDGSFYESRNLPMIGLGVSRKSLQMLKKFRKITKCGYYRYKISVKQLLQIFKILDIKFGDPPLPPKWVVTNPNIFGAYLAGVIDGDGDVRIKRPKYPQCVVRISSGRMPKELRKEIKNNLKCEVSSTFRTNVSYLNGRKILGKWCTIEFCVSKKNREFIRNFILPYMTLIYKSHKLSDFIN